MHHPLSQYCAPQHLHNNLIRSQNPCSQPLSDPLPLSLARSCPHNRYSGAASWQDLHQIDFLPPTVRAALPSLTFAVNGTPAHYTPIHGYDRTTYNGQDPKDPIDVSHISGVFAGWTASDLVATVADAVRLTHDIYGPQPNIIPAEVARTMVPKANESWCKSIPSNRRYRVTVATE